MGGKTLMTGEAASRIQSSTAKKGDGGVPKNSFAARAQSAAAKNDNTGLATPANTDTQSGVTKWCWFL